MPASVVPIETSSAQQALNRIGESGQRRECEEKETDLNCELTRACILTQ